MQLSNNLEFDSLLLGMATNLFDDDKVSCYGKHFSDNLLSGVLNHHSFLSKNRLKIELMAVYNREELQAVSETISCLTLVSQDAIRCNF